MSRFSRCLLVIMLFGVFALAVCSAVVLILSGGQPIQFIQTELVRLSLIGRERELDLAASPGDETPVRFAIATGDTPRTIGQNLFIQGLIVDSDLFVDFVRVEQLDRQLQAGTYFLNRGLTLRQIAYALTDSSTSQISFRFPEGLRQEEIAARIDSPDFRAYFLFAGADFLASISPNAIDSTTEPFRLRMGIPQWASLDGFLFPDSYRLPPDISPLGLRDTLLLNFQTRVGEQIIQDAAAQGLSMYQVISLAAIIQREAIHPDEHPMIASVYRNRLRIGMTLDADPTVQYAVGFRDNTWWPRITAAEYRSAVSPYNTYLNTGLPPGPIANPGLSAIQAAVYPAESPYFFFRADCRPDGYHTFAITYEEHLANGC